MKMSRRSAVIAGSIATLAVAGTLVAGPAIARGGAHQNGFPTSNAQGPNGNVVGRVGGMGMMDADGRGMMGGHGHGMGDMDGDHGMPNGVARGRMLHNEGVIATSDATGKVTYVTVRQQSGKVVSATDSTMVVKSDDGVEWSWTISPTARIDRNGAAVKASAFVKDDVVELHGTVASGVATAIDIHNHAARPVPAPTATASTTGSNA